jgi:formylglycine-generating enzyme required for sulfatase activity
VFYKLEESDMSHIFISYSHHDTDYAHALAENLQNIGLDVWIDERMDYGSQWPHELQKQLDSCSAFILIMSPRSYASEWVQSELQRAKRKLKPIFPLLLEGDEPWLSVESTQYYDVRGEKFPDAKFYSAIANVVSPPEGEAIPLPVDVGKPVKPKSPASAPKLRAEIVIGIIGAIATLLAAVIPIIWSNLSKDSTPPPANNVTSSSPTISSSGTLNPNPTPAITSTIPSNTPEISNSAEIPDAKGVPMRFVSAGNFIMGSDSGYENERPVHTVYLDDFYIDKYEVTNASYKACVDASACQPPNQTSSFTRDSYFGNSEYDNYPVVFVDWEDARSYCQWRGIGIDLPTEAQWEKAARGTDGRIYPWGNNIDQTYANYNDTVGDTTEVGSYENGRSPYGVYDMAGNAWEWVADWLSDTYYLDTPLTNPPGPTSGQYRVLRGGSWHDDKTIVTTSNRGWNQLEYFDNIDFGFRCAMDGKP